MSRNGGEGQNNYSKVKALAKELENDTVITYPFLFVQMLDGDHNTALILKELVYWSDKGSRKDGRFYKSIPDLSAETGLTSRRIRRSLTVLEDAGLIEREVLRAQGAPTNHFKLHMEKLEELMLKCSDLTKRDLHEMRKSQKGRSIVTKGQIHSDKRADEILTKGQIHSDKRADPEQPTTQPTTQPTIQPNTQPTITTLLGETDENAPEAPDKTPKKKRDPKKDPKVKEAFDRFWKEYPKKRAKQDAWGKWARLDPDEALQEEIMVNLRKQKRSKQWTRQKGQYIPQPNTWINQRRWEDEFEPVRGIEGEDSDYGDPEIAEIFG